MVGQDVNIYERAETFADWVRWAASYYATPNVMLTMGSDFEYTAAHTCTSCVDVWRGVARGGMGWDGMGCGMT